MKISNSTPNYINQSYNAAQNNAALNQNQKNQTSTEEKAADSINLSATTRDMQKIAKSMETDSPERKQYVDKLRNQVQNDQYNVNAEAVADKLVGSIVDGMI